MLGDFDALPIVAVKDPDRARRFYRDVLGLKPVGDETDVLAIFQAGSSRLVVYPSALAGTNKANAVAWAVGPAFDEIIAGLEEKNVTFEHNEESANMVREGNVYRAGSIKFAWIRDPDGNILNINSMERAE